MPFIEFQIFKIYSDLFLFFTHLNKVKKTKIHYQDISSKHCIFQSHLYFSASVYLGRHCSLQRILFPSHLNWKRRSHSGPQRAIIGREEYSFVVLNSQVIPQSLYHMQIAIIKVFETP